MLSSCQTDIFWGCLPAVFLYIEKSGRIPAGAAVVWAGWVTAVFMEPVGKGGQPACPPLSIGGMAVIHAVHAWAWELECGQAWLSTFHNSLLIAMIFIRRK